MFKIGDIITGTEEADYYYKVTNNHAILKVTAYISDMEMLEVLVIDHRTDKDWIGRKYAVEAKYFRYFFEDKQIRLKATINRIEKRHLLC